MAAPAIMKNGFLSLADHALDQCRQHGHKAAFLVIKLADPMDDAMLAEISTRIWETIGEEDLVARIHAQDFAVLLSRVTSTEVGNKMALKLMRAIGLKVSIGVSTGPWSNESADGLMRAAMPREQRVIRRIPESIFAV